MRKIILTLIKMCFLVSLSAVEMQPNITKLYYDHIDITKNDDLKNFRSMKNPKSKVVYNTAGLEKLRASGSSQFTEKGLAEIQERLGPVQLIVVDLRNELHGLINGFPVHWKLINSIDSHPTSTDVGDIVDQENRWIDEAQTVQASIVRGYYTISQEDEAKPLKLLKEEIAALLSPDWKMQKLRVKEITSGKKEGKIKVKMEIAVDKAIREEILCRSKGLIYFRIPVVDYYYPKDSEVDRFILLYKALGPESWLHFHCKAGKGRTTSFLSMLDMMKNAKDVSFEDIIYRQSVLGEINLVAAAESDWGHARLEFLQAFYQYCLENIDNDFSLNWSDWVKTRDQCLK